MESDYVGTCHGCGLSSIDGDDLLESFSCPECGSSDITWDAVEDGESCESEGGD